MGNFSDSASWKWRLIVRFMGAMFLMTPFLLNIMAVNPSFGALLIAGGFLLIMVS
jgi:hypothetical protein